MANCDQRESESRRSEEHCSKGRARCDGFEGSQQTAAAIEAASTAKREKQAEESIVERDVCDKLGVHTAIVSVCSRPEPVMWSSPNLASRRVCISRRIPSSD